jgi:membrane associated rhomboid family serine protease
MDMEVRNPARDIAALAMLDTLLRALGTRALILLTLAMTFGLACWAMSRESTVHCLVAAGFCFGVLWPVLYIGWKSKE